MNVYIIEANNAYKIGKANNIQDRIADLQTGNQYELKLFTSFSCDTEQEAYSLEANLHRMFAHKSLQGEWFRLDFTDLTYVKTATKEKLLTVVKTEVQPQKIIIDKPTHFLVSSNLIDIMSEMSPQEQWLFKIVKEAITGSTNDLTCKVFIPSSELTNAEKQKLKIAYKRLREKDLIRRIKRQHYMVNPMMLIPTFFDEEFDRYSQLT